MEGKKGIVKRLNFVSAILLLLILVAVTAMLQAAENSDRATRLANGEILTQCRPVAGSNYEEGTVEAIIKASPSRVWEILVDLEAYPKFMPRVTSCKIDRSRSTDRSVVATTVLTFGFSKVKYTLRYDLNRDARTIHWNLVESTDLKAVKGSWSLKPHGQDTLAIYNTFVEPGSIANLPFFQSNFKRRCAKDLPLVMEAVRKKATGK